MTPLIQPPHFTLQHVLQATGGTLIHPGLSSLSPHSGPLSTDSRTLAAGQWFIPLVGERFDGHDFVGDAIGANVAGCLVQATHVDALLASGLVAQAQCPIVSVPDTTCAYLALAGFFRAQQRQDVIVIGVTGSSGKTTVKEMLVAALSPYFEVAYTPKNFNNDIGVAQTLLACPASAQVLVVEMGMRGLGEIERLSVAAQPNIAVITSVGSAHIGRLGSREAIAQAKAEIVTGLTSHPTLPGSPAFVYPCDATLLTPWLDQLDETIQLHGFTAQIGVVASLWPGEYMQANVNIVCQVGLLCGLTPEQVANGLAQYHVPEGRGQVHQLAFTPPLTVVEDAYNANPESMQASIQSFSVAYPTHVPLVLLGGMKELGDHSLAAHQDVIHTVARVLGEHPLKQQAKVWCLGEEFSAVDLSPLFALGIEAHYHPVASFAELATHIAKVIRQMQSPSALLIKGSRAYTLEKLLPEL